MGSEVKSMEIKKAQSSSSESTLSIKKVQNFVAAMKGEIQNVEWTNKNELITYTKIVVVATFLFGMSIYLLDLVIQGTLSGLNVLLNYLVG